MRRATRTAVVMIVGLLLAASGSAFMAGNTVDPSSAGDGHSQGPVSTSVVDGQTVYSVPSFTIP